MSGIAPFTAGLFISAGISAAVAVFIQRRRGTPGIQAFVLQMVFQAIWALGFAFETIAPDLPTKLLFRKIAWIGILLVPIFWTFFVLRYTRNDRWLNRGAYLGLGLPVFFLLLMAFTNEFHFLFWSSVTLAPGIGTGVVYGRGPFFWVAIGFAYAIVITALVEMVWAAAQSPRLYRHQAALLLFAAGLPLLTSILFIMKIVQPFDWTPLGFSVTGLVVSWAIFRYQLFNLLPVARGRLFEMLPDGLLALDTQNRVVDANPALLAIANYTGQVPAGEPVERLFTAEPELLEGIRRPRDGGDTVRNRSGEKLFSIQRSPLQIQAASSEGWLVVIRDVTTRQKVEQRLRTSEENLRRLFEANPFPHVIVGVEQSTIYAFNQAFLDFFHVAADEMINRRATEFLAQPDLRQTLLEVLAQKGNLRDQIVEMVRSPNERCMVLLTADPVELMGEKRLLVSFVDISERLRLERVEHEQRVFSEVLVETSAMIHGTLELDEVLDRILENLRRVVRHDVANVMLVNEERLAYTARTRGYSERGLESPFGKVWLNIDTTPNLRWMVENRRPEIRADVSTDEQWVLVAGQDWMRGHLGAPIITSLGVAGFLNLDSTEKNFYSETDAERLMIFANQAGVAIDNARLYSQVRKAAQESEVLQQITLAVGSNLDFYQVIQRMFDLIDRLVPSDSVGIQMIEGQEVVLKAFRGFANSEEILGTRWAMAGTVNERAYQAGRPLIFSDVQAEFSGYRVPPHNQIRSVLIIPLKAGGDVIGFLSLDSWVLAHFGDDDLRLANLFAGNVAAALENARLYEESQRRTKELEILNRAGLAVTSGLDLDQILMGLYEQCRLAMTADSFYVALYHKEDGVIDFPLFQDQGIFRQVQSTNINLRMGITGLVIEDGKTVYLPDTLDPKTSDKYRMVRFGGVPTRSYLGVPLVLRDQVIGVISMQSTLPNAYAPNQVRLLETISTQAAIAIENARLYKQAQTAATIDELTGLLSRRELFRRAEQEFERANRYRHNLTVMMIDIDHFKVVNDTFGHLAGDQVLRSMARVCQENMRLVDVVGRYGGEEILILMPETTAEQAMGAAERLRREIEEMVVTVDRAQISVTISTGVAGLHPADAGVTLSMMITRADAALFVAKSAGRNRVCLSEG